MAAAGCDKAKELAGGGAQAAEPPPSERLDLSRRPDILFQVFGEREEPRMVPVAAIVGGRLRPVVLTASGWQQFDALYNRSGTSYNLYRDGRARGILHVRQGMWEKHGQPIYSLPGCQLLTPIALVALDDDVRAGYTVEFLASTATLASSASAQPLSPAETEAVARNVAIAAGRGADITKPVVGKLDFKAVSLASGATAQPTVVASFLNPSLDSQGDVTGKVAHVFLIADVDAAGNYQPTFTHTYNGAAGSAEYRRYLDHLDVNQDGVDELVLEGWHYGGETFLSVLGYAKGRWREIYRARSSWCLD